MKFVLWNVLLTGFVFTSCSQQKKDREIKAEITVKSKQEIAFAAVSATVREGVVTLTGTCPSSKAREKAGSTVKQVPGVKGVINQINIAPVVLDTDPYLKQSVDSVLKQYALAQAQVEQNKVLLTGEAPANDIPKILQGLQKLSITSIDNKLIPQDQ